MPGVSNSALWSYLTPLRLYRGNVVAADAAPGGALPVIAADVSARRTAAQTPLRSGPASGFGSNTTLVLAVKYAPTGGATVGLRGERLASGASPTHADILVWRLAEAAVGYDGLDAPAPSWVLAYERSVLCDTQLVICDLPAAQYCVTVGFMSPGVVSIFEQHTE